MAFWPLFKCSHSIIKTHELSFAAAWMNYVKYNNLKSVRKGLYLWLVKSKISDLSEQQHRIVNQKMESKEEKG